MMKNYTFFAIAALLVSTSVFYAHIDESSAIKKEVVRTVSALKTVEPVEVIAEEEFVQEVAQEEQEIEVVAEDAAE